MFVLAKNNSIVALDAVTGQGEVVARRTTAQSAIAGSTTGRAAIDPTAGCCISTPGSLTAIDARTGDAIPSFGEKGRVDVRVGLHRDLTEHPARCKPTIPDASIENSDHRIAAGRRRGIRGEPRATFTPTTCDPASWCGCSTPCPERGEFGADTWPEAALARPAAASTTGASSPSTRRAASSTSRLGTARYDFYGGNRHGANLFANSSWRSTRRTGKRACGTSRPCITTCGTTIWPTAPKLLTVKHDGRDVRRGRAGEQARLPVRLRSRDRRAAVADRGAAGAAVRRAWRADVADAAVPDAAAAVRAPVVHREGHQPAYRSPEAQEKLRQLLRNSVNKGLFTPPSLQGSIQMPGNSGGANWGLLAADPVKGRVYVMSKEAPALLDPFAR